MKDSRGNPYGVGSLKDSQVKGKQKLEDSSCYVALEEQVKEAQRKIEEHVAYSQRRDAVLAVRETQVAAREAEQKCRLEQLSLVEKYLLQTDPHFPEFMASQSSRETTTDPNTPSPSAS